jgi:pyruvate formate lyase activating enzyme
MDSLVPETRTRPLTPLVAANLDLKAFDPERHRRLTEKDVGPTIEFARRLAARRRPVWLRFVLVPGLTDDIGDLEHLADCAATLGNVEFVDILPFHQLGRHKWKRLGLDYLLASVDAPSPAAVERVCAVFRAAGLAAF